MSKTSINTLSADELYVRVGEVLHYFWDPIGIAGIPAIRDEYDSYVPKVYELLVAGKSEKTIAKYLMDVEHESIGLPRRPAEAAEAASILMDWKYRLKGSPKKSKRKIVKRSRPIARGRRIPTVAI